MGAKVLASPGKISKNEFHELFLAILADQCKAAIDEAAHCTASILELTAQYLDKPAFETLQEFYALYFTSGGAIEEQKTAINDEVDDLVAQLQAQLERGEELAVAAEDEATRELRLSLSAIQKRLEGLITLDSGMREKILPAISAMQCEDAIRQRLDHVVGAWRELVQAMAQGVSNFEALARSMAVQMSSVEETEAFYRLVLEEKAPEGVSNRSVFIEF